MLVVGLFLRSLGRPVLLARGTHPLALGGLLQLRLQTDQVVRLGTRVAQDDLASLLAHLRDTKRQEKRHGEGVMEESGGASRVVAVLVC